ncbi:MAG: hypothetical protein WDZ89_01580, partial [Gemmatimonadota bacterium]
MDRARPKHIAQPQADLARPLAHVAAAATAAFLLLVVASCDGGPSEPPAPKTLIEVVNGAGQAAPSTLPVAPSVRVTDTTGQPLENVAVTFETTRGGGSLQGATTTTGADGVARLGGWTLGPGSGRQTVTVSARDARATVSASSTLWVAVGDNGVTATSPTGEVWTIRENPVDFRAWNAVATDSMWVAVGMGPTHGAISLDGIHWTGKNMPFTGHGVGIGWSGSRFVATGDSREFTAAISDNGDSWTGRLTPFTARGRGVAFGGGLWVATGEGGASIATSPDGEEWTPPGLALRRHDGRRRLPERNARGVERLALGGGGRGAGLPHRHIPRRNHMDRAGVGHRDPRTRRRVERRDVDGRGGAGAEQHRDHR